MGYTHYAYLPKDMSAEKFKAFTKDVKAIIEETEHLLGNGWGEKGTTPTINEAEVAFNGFGEKGHETCHIPFLSGGEGTKFTFCKTARKPYDKYVTATYIAVKHHFPKTELASDGDIDGFKEGLDLFCEKCRDIEMPELG